MKLKIVKRVATEILGVQKCMWRNLYQKKKVNFLTSYSQGNANKGPKNIGAGKTNWEVVPRRK